MIKPSDITNITFPKEHHATITMVFKDNIGTYIIDTSTIEDPLHVFNLGQKVWVLFQGCLGINFDISEAQIQESELDGSLIVVWSDENEVDLNLHKIFHTKQEAIERVIRELEGLKND